MSLHNLRKCNFCSAEFSQTIRSVSSHSCPALLQSIFPYKQSLAEYRHQLTKKLLTELMFISGNWHGHQPLGICHCNELVFYTLTFASDQKTLEKSWQSWSCWSLSPIDIKLCRHLFTFNLIPISNLGLLANWTCRCFWLWEESSIPRANPHRQICKEK